MNTEKIYEILNRATDLLFVKNPRETSMGVVFGVVLDGIIKFFQPALSNWSAVSFSELTVFHFVFLGILLFNLPSLFSRRKLSSEIEDAFVAIKEIKRRTELPIWQEKLMYIKLCNEVINRAQLDKEVKSKFLEEPPSTSS